MRHLTKVFSAMVLLTGISTVHAQQQMGGPGGGQDNGGPGGGQDNGGPGGGGPGGGPDGGPPDPQEMQARMDKRIKSALSVSDDTWATLQPLIDKVEQLEHETDTGPLMHGRPHRPGGDDDNGGGSPGGGPGGGPGASPSGGPGADNNGGGPGDDHPQSPVESAVSDLKKVLADNSSTDEKIEEAMKTAQEAEKKARDDLKSARKDLRAAVSMRQQAVLVALGVLN